MRETEKRLGTYSVEEIEVLFTHSCLHTWSSLHVYRVHGTLYLE